MSVTCDLTKLQQLFAELDPKRRLSTIKGAFRKEANNVRRVAVNNLLSSGLHATAKMARGIRALVFRRTAGFRVTVAPGKGDKGMYTNHRGLKKPVLLWAEGGTERRETKTRSRVFIRSRKGHNTGQMQRYGFMRKTLEQVSDKVTSELHDELIQKTINTAKKYGCR